MKTKLTLSVDEDVVKRSKEYAARHGSSLSQFVEDLLDENTRDDEPTFAEKWRGKLAVRERPGDPRYEYLKRKYDL
jgi:hypothetical protein